MPTLRKLQGVFCLSLILLVLSGCAAPQKEVAEPATPPTQNLMGSTDELQLVTELAINLAKEHGGDQVLVALEIDNTLLVLDQESGSAQQSVCSKETTMQPAQDDAAKQVSRMQAVGLKVIALTSRGPDCLQQTLRELGRNGFSFQDSAWSPQNGYPAEFSSKGGDLPVLYQKGVFFAAGQDKGLMLKNLLDKSGEPYPALIIMVDYKQDNLTAVMKAFSWTRTKAHTWRYTRLETVPVSMVLK